MTTSTKTGRDSVSPQEMNKYATDCFSCMLGLDLLETPDAALIEDDGFMQATIKISGVWEAELNIYASVDLATTMASAMFAAAPEDLSDDEVRDAFGEVVNILGGNVKGGVEGECKLSLPCVGAKFTDPAGMSLSYVCEGFPFNVSLLETSNS